MNANEENVPAGFNERFKFMKNVSKFAFITSIIVGALFWSLNHSMLFDLPPLVEAFLFRSLQI